MHILTRKLRQFGRKKTIETVWRDLYDKNKITNVLDDREEEARNWLCMAIWDDYRYKRANYEAYLEPGMDARLMMELRKNAVLQIKEDDYWFFEKHSECTSIEDVKKLRTDYISAINSDYKDLPWQYYCVAKFWLRCSGNFSEFAFDYEVCFADGDPEKQTHVDDYEMDFVRAHMDGYHWLSREACDAIGGRWID